MTKEELIQKLKTLKVLSVDIDGTMTDSGIYLNKDGDQYRKFHAQDGAGLIMVQKLGVKIVLLTSSKEKLCEVRAKLLGADYFIFGTFEKYKELKKITDSLNISMDDVMHIGDDVNDLSALLKVGFPIAVKNAVEPVRKVAIYCSEKDANNGAVREICELVLIAKTGYPFGEPFVVGEDYKALTKIYDQQQD